MSLPDARDLNVANAYSSFRQSEESAKERDADSWVILTRLLLTILARIGFFLVQIGSVPVTNVNLVLLQNIVDFSWVTIVYLLGGFVVAFNGDSGGLVGQGQWIGNENSIDKDEILVGWQATMVASAIYTSLLVGRTHVLGYLLIGFIVSGILQPFAIHWSWTPNGWMAHNNFLGHDVAFYDFAGSAVVHIVGSLTGYIGCVILGRRIIRLRDIDDASVPTDSAGTALAGYFFILLGLQSLCLPSSTLKHPRSTKKNVSMIIVNNLLGASSSSLVVVALHFILSREPFNYWTVMRCIQASIAGTIIVSAGVHFYNPLLCLGLGCTGGIIHYIVSRRVFQSALEDYCNVIPTHLLSSLVGSLVAPFALTTSESVKNPILVLVHFSWQLICLIAIVGLVTLPVAVAFGFLECLGLLRNRSEIINHLRAIVAADRGPPRSHMQRLFLPEGETLYFQPCTARVRSPGNQAIPRSLNDGRARIQIHKANEARKMAKSQVSFATSSPNVVARSTRVKKLRQVHTLRSHSEITMHQAKSHKKAMGDDQNSGDDEKIVAPEADENSYDFGKTSGMECSGDSSMQLLKIYENSLIHKLSDLPIQQTKKNVTRDENSPPKKLKRPRESYRLHRTQKSTNLRLDAINEIEPSVKFLVRPSVESFSSTETDSENESIAETPKKYLKSWIPSVALESTRKTVELTDLYKSY